MLKRKQGTLKKRSLLFLSLLMMLVLMSGCSNNNNIEKSEHLQALEDFMAAFQTTDIPKMGEYLTGEDARRIGADNPLEMGDLGVLEQIFEKIKYNVLEEIETESPREKRFLVNVKSKNILSFVNQSKLGQGSVSVDKAQTLNQDMEFIFRKINNKWILINGGDIFEKTLGLSN